jgi:hypothetical protein
MGVIVSTLQWFAVEMLHGCLETPSLPIAPVTNGKPLTPQCASCLFIDAYVRRPQTASWTWGSADWHTTDWHGTVPHHDIQFSSIKCLCNQRNGVVVLFNHTPSNGPPLRFSSLKLYNRLLAVVSFLTVPRFLTLTPLYTLCVRQTVHL